MHRHCVAGDDFSHFGDLFLQGGDVAVVLSDRCFRSIILLLQDFLLRRHSFQLVREGLRAGLQFLPFDHQGLEL